MFLLWVFSERQEAILQSSKMVGRVYAGDQGNAIENKVPSGANLALRKTFGGPEMPAVSP
jgi:hypothetical protein